MKHQSVVLKNDIKTNLNNTFPEVFKKGTIGQKILVIDKENGLTLVEVKVKNKIYLYAFNESDIMDIQE